MRNSHPQRRASDRPLRWRVMLVLALLPVVFVVGRVTAPRWTVAEAEAAPTPRALPVGVERFHDASEAVTCWQRAGAGLSCLPDQWLASATAEGGAP